MVKAIVYDFDGVVCDSVNVKTDAFAEMYKKYGNEITQEVVRYHLDHGGVSRFEKFKHWHRTFFGIELTEEQLTEMGNIFSSIALEKVISSPFIDGADIFIQTNAEKYLQFICTGTPETEIVQILEKKKLTRYFSKSYGSPRSKQEILRTIMDENKLGADEMIFLGDAITDYIVAKETGVPFVGIKNEHTVFPLETIVINNFLDPKLVKSIV